jgi:6-phosphogluconolactonase
MPLRIVADASALADTAAREVVEVGRAALAERGRFLIALSGGSTPRAMHARLAQPPLSAALNWTQVEFFWSDERSVPPESPDSNYGMALATLLTPLGIHLARVHRLEGEASDLDAAARSYERVLATVAGADPRGDPPALDLVLLGMGADGHTGSLFPRTAALDVTGRWVVANDVPQLHTRRLTFTFDLILRAREVRVLVAGADKAAALASVWSGPPAAHDFPSQRLAGQDSRVAWLVDRAAASALPATLTAG